MAGKDPCGLQGTRHFSNKCPKAAAVEDVSPGRTDAPESRTPTPRACSGQVLRGTVLPGLHGSSQSTAGRAGVGSGSV